MPKFRVASDFAPAGDQPRAIAALAEGIREKLDFQTLLGVTGSGKTATIAWTVEHQKPILVISPNKFAGGSARERVQGVLPRQRGRVLRQLLRLVPARGRWTGGVAAFLFIDGRS